MSSGKRFRRSIKRTVLVKKALRNSEKNPRPSDELKEAEITQPLGGLILDGFANGFGCVVDQGERDFPGAHLENCFREYRG